MWQDTTQFLNSVLSQRGQSALPYSEEMKWHIRQHLLYLTEEFPSMKPNVVVFSHKDGRTVNLLTAKGTVPITFRNVEYNIPVIIWLMESYPLHAPRVLVDPIKRNDVVSMPYLDSWVFPGSNLVELVRNLSQLFARIAVYSNPNPNFTPNLPSARPAPPSSYVYSPAPPYCGGKIVEDPAEIFNSSSDIGELRLRKRKEELKSRLNKIRDKREGVEQHLRTVLMNLEFLDQWLRKNEGKFESKVLDDVDEDAMAKQMLDYTACDLAMDDAVYALDKAVRKMKDMYKAMRKCTCN